MTPMELQYLVGLCCLRRSPDDVEIVLGDMVLDEASQKHRDVDVTVRLKGNDGTVTAFMGVEVKQESKPFDVGTVEQLNANLMTIPGVDWVVAADLIAELGVDMNVFKSLRILSWPQIKFGV